MLHNFSLTYREIRLLAEMDFLTGPNESGNMFDAYGDVWRVWGGKKRSVKSWLLLARFIADFFAHRRVRRRLISNATETISVDSRSKLRAYARGLIRFIWLETEICPVGFSQIGLHTLSSALVTWNGLVRSQLIACYTQSRCWLTNCPLSDNKKIY